MFADALTGGDIAKLNEGMKDAKFKGKDLLKVAAHMKTLVDPKLMEQMLKAPEKQVTRMKNSWLEFITALNDSGLWGSIGSGLDSLTAGVKALTREVRYIYPVFANFFRFLFENAGTLTAVWIAFKGFGTTMAVFSTAAAAGQVMTLTTAFKALAAAMLRTVVIPAAIVTAILLAVDTIQAFQEKKKGVLLDAREKTTDNNKKKLGSSAGSNLVDKMIKLQKDPEDTWNKLQFANALGGYNQLGKDVPDAMTPEEKHQMVMRVRKNVAPNVLNDETVANMLRDLDASYQLQQASSSRVDPLNPQASSYDRFASKNSSAVINVTIQNTEPNVSKEWLTATLPSVFGDAMNQHVQKEWSMFPNQSGGTK